MAKLTTYFERKVGARITRSVVLRPDPPVGKVHGFRYTAEILAVENHRVTFHLTRMEIVPTGNTVAGTLVRFGDWDIPLNGLLGLDTFWADALDNIDEIDSATQVKYGSMG